MQLNKAVSQRLNEILQQKGITQYQLYMKSGALKSTIGDVINCVDGSLKLQIIHEFR